MDMIARIAEAWQTVLGPVAQEAGRQSGLIQRVRKLDGASFVRLLVLGYQGQPEATLEDLVKVGASMGVPLSPQGLAQRFTAEAARCVQQVLEAAIGQVVAATPAVDGLLGRFSGLYLQDATTFALPDELAALWAGVGGSGPQAALKVQVQWEYRTGQVTHLQLQSATCHDTQAACQRAPLPAGALRLTDLGYFKLAQMAHDLAQGVYWLTRLHAQCRLRLAGVAQPLSCLARPRPQPVQSLSRPPPLCCPLGGCPHHARLGLVGTGVRRYSTRASSLARASPSAVKSPPPSNSSATLPSFPYLDPYGGEECPLPLVGYAHGGVGYGLSRRPVAACVVRAMSSIALIRAWRSSA